MRRFISMMLVIVFVLSFAGCAAINRISQGQKDGKYKDGVYEGAGDPWDYGSENATVTIDDGKIKDITLRRFDKQGKEVDYNQFAGQTANGKTYPNLKQARFDMANRMIDKQTSDVDLVTGATISTKNWKVSVKRALEKAANK